MKRLSLVGLVTLTITILTFSSVSAEFMTDYLEYNPFTNQPDATVSSTTVSDSHVPYGPPNAGEWHYDVNGGTHSITVASITVPSPDNELYIATNTTINGTVTATTVAVTGLTNGSVIFSDGTNLAEDNINLMWDTTNKTLQLGETDSEDTITIGGVEYKSHLKVNEFTDDHLAMFQLHRHSTNDALGALIVGSRSNSSGAGHGVVTNNQVLFGMMGTGWSDDDYDQAGQIRIEADGTYGADDSPGRITLWTTPDGTNTPVERMRLDTAGDLDLYSGDLTTLGKVTGEQLTSTDDIAMAGLLSNTMGTSDNAGLNMQNNNFTSPVATNVLFAKMIINQPASSSGFDHSGLTFQLTNNHIFNSGFGPTQSTKGILNQITSQGAHSAAAIIGLEDSVTGIVNSASGGSRSITAGASFGSVDLEAIGMDNTAALSSINFNSAGDTLNLEVFGMKNSAAAQANTLTAGTMNTNVYGEWIDVAGGTAGTSTGYAIYLNRVTGFDTKWAYYNDTVADNFMGGDNIESRWGSTSTDLIIESDGTDGIIAVGNKLIIKGSATYKTNGTDVNFSVDSASTTVHDNLNVEGEVIVGNDDGVYDLILKGKNQNGPIITAAGGEIEWWKDNTTIAGYSYIQGGTTLLSFDDTQQSTLGPDFPHLTIDLATGETTIKASNVLNVDAELILGAGSGTGPPGNRWPTSLRFDWEFNTPAGYMWADALSPYHINISNTKPASGASFGTIRFIPSTGAAIFNEGGNSAGDFRIEGDTVNNLFFTDASADEIEVRGDFKIVSDSKKIFFGAGSDGSIEFDGNSLNIKANEVTDSDIIVLDSSTTVTGLTTSKLVWTDVNTNFVSQDINISDVINTAITATTMNVITGTLSAGTTAQTRVWGEGGAVNISEVTGAPGFDVQFIFMNVTDFARIGISAYYTGNIASHYAEIQIYDDTNAVWRTLWNFSGGQGFNYRYSDLPVSVATRQADYINSSNEVMIRFYHPTSGNASHDLFIDYMSIIK